MLTQGRKDAESAKVLMDRSLLPPLDGLPPALVDELVQLESLPNEALWELLFESITSEPQEALEDLLYKNREGLLTGEEQEELAKLHEEASKIMLRKARAGVLLRLRGQPLPTLAEFEKLSRTRRRK